MILVYKPLGLTPLQAIERLKRKKPELSDKTLSYAGRLDPMAEGLLLILVGEENKNRREFELLDKEYEFEALLGIKTDSYDMLGIPKTGKVKQIKTFEVDGFVKKNSQKITQEYPPYSSFRVEGKPLYWWARQGKKVSIPKREISIRKLEFVGRYKICPQKVLETIIARINLVKGDFRQQLILKHWQNLLEEISKKKEFQILKFKISCSSGTYIRSLVDDFGKELSVGAVTYSIKRTKIGKFTPHHNAPNDRSGVHKPPIESPHCPDRKVVGAGFTLKDALML